MPEESIASEEKSTQPQVEEFPTLQKKNSKKWLWIFVALIVLALIGVGVWVLIAKPFGQPSKETEKQATSSAKKESEKPKETKSERTKFAYVHNGNVWVLDVQTKSKMQITNDSGNGTYYLGPRFVDEDTFTYLKQISSKSELWSADITTNQFTIKQVKKFDKTISLYDVDQNLKTIAYLILEEAQREVYISSLDDSKVDKKVTYDLGTDAFGRGGFQDDAFYVRLSPDAAKVLIVDTALIPSKAMIIVWDVNGNKLGELNGNITMPVWKDNNTLIYRDVDNGVFSYDIDSKSKNKLSGDKNWVGLAISPDAKNLAYNKGFKSGDGITNKGLGVYVFDLETRTDRLIGESLFSARWVGSQFLVAEKLKKCLAADNDWCPGEDYYMPEGVFVITNLKTDTSYEVSID